jgi:hypothetical protein
MSLIRAFFALAVIGLCGSVGSSDAAAAGGRLQVGGPTLQLQINAYPLDFHFAVPVEGSGFKPGEQVHVWDTAVGSEATATADASGRFTTTLSFTWIFCGADGLAQPAPTVGAYGDQGSSVPPAPLGQPGACPWMYEREGADSKPYGSWRHLVPITMSVFGFAPGQRVTIREAGTMPKPLPPIHVTAGPQGDAQVTVPLYVAGKCNFAAKENWLVLTAGVTDAIAHPLTPDQPAICPPNKTMRKHPQPSYNGAYASIHISPTTASPGDQVTARLVDFLVGRVRISVTYPGGGTTKRTATLQDVTGDIQWKVPTTVRTGKARVTMTLPGLDNPPLHAAFQIR